MKKLTKSKSVRVAALCCTLLLASTGGARADPAPAEAATTAPTAATELLAPDLALAPELAPGELSEKTIEDAPIEAAAELVSAVRAGDWRKTVALALSLLMLAFGRFRRNFKFLKGDRAGVVILFAMSTAGALTTSLFGNAPVDYRMFMSALEIGLYAMGGFLGVKKLFWPDDDDPGGRLE